MRRPARVTVAVLAAAALTAGGAALAFSDPEGEVAGATAAAGQAATPPPGPEPDEQPPLPKPRPKLVQPQAGVSAHESRRRSKTADLPTVDADDTSLPRPTGPASRTSRAGAEQGAGGVQGDPNRATALPNGVALPPLEAPQAVLDVIRAGNAIARTPYKWGGGHGRFLDDGYDCSGSVTFALYSAGLIGGSQTSGQLMSYGKPGKGRWITLYANEGHVFMEVAGIRFDTSGRARTGSRWQNDRRPTAGYVARHPPGY